MTPEQIKEKYEPRIIALLTAMRTALLEYDLHVESPWLMEDEEFSWWMLVQTEAQHNAEELDGIDVRFTILESEHWDGEKNGVNFGIDITSVGGSIVGGLTPYNYTDEVWVSRDDEDAVEERFVLLETADTADAAELITNWLREEAA